MRYKAKDCGITLKLEEFRDELCEETNVPSLLLTASLSSSRVCSCVSGE